MPTHLYPSLPIACPPPPASCLVLGQGSREVLQGDKGEVLEARWQRQEWQHRVEGQDTVISSLAPQGLLLGCGNVGCGRECRGNTGDWDQGSGEVQVTLAPYFALFCPSRTTSTPTVPKKMGWQEGWVPGPRGGEGKEAGRRGG